MGHQSQFFRFDPRIYIPIASCIIISIVLTIVLWLVSYFRR
ncbi:MAG: DUF2905 family protein [Planctomycetota bacterium]